MNHHKVLIERRTKHGFWRPCTELDYRNVLGKELFYPPHIHAQYYSMPLEVRLVLSDVAHKANKGLSYSVR